MAVPLTDPIKTPENRYRPQRSGNRSADLRQEDHCSTPSPEGIIRIPLKKLHQADTALLPIAYPTFLKQYFHPETDIPFQMEKAEKLELSLLGKDKTESIIELGEIWLE